MTQDDLLRGIRAKKEDYIVLLTKKEGKVRATDLYGLFSMRYKGTAIRTFLNEYLVALSYRREVVLQVDGQGYWVYEPSVYESEQANKVITP